MTPNERRLRNLAIVTVCCIAWGILIVLGVGAWDWAFTYYGANR